MKAQPMNVGTGVTSNATGRRKAPLTFRNGFVANRARAVVFSTYPGNPRVTAASEPAACRRRAPSPSEIA